MKASDTVLSMAVRDYYRVKAQKAVEDYYRVENPNNEPLVPNWLNNQAKQLCRDVALEELTEQAIISFKAGYDQCLKDHNLK